jgi:hypothetical protein
VISSVSLVHGTIIIFDFLYYIQTSFFSFIGTVLATARSRGREPDEE